MFWKIKDLILLCLQKSTNILLIFINLHRKKKGSEVCCGGVLMIITKS